MSDSNLRELERRWRETGGVEDEAAWLRARVQAGELEQSRLELAAYCGHAPAGLSICGDVARRLSESTFSMDESTNVQAWCYGLPDLFEHEAAIRLALEFAWRAELTWRTVVPPTDLSPAIFAELVDRPRRALETFDEFLCGSASGESLAVAHSLLEEVSREWGDPFGEPIEEGPEGVKWEALGYVARFCDLPGHLYATPLCCEDYVEEFTSVGTFVGHVLYESLFSRTDFAASKTELSRWALGYCDPVRERVQARQRDAARE